MRLVFAILALQILLGCNSSTNKPLKKYSYTNELINESSPYLLQHAHNPVNWKAWNETTLQQAKEERKLMIVSIGYAACHWCHVMENESFEDSTVAAAMNNNFISVKVDREERPDVDQTYINAVQLMTGSAGWPLNVVTLPDGRPVWGGTYFRKNDWINALEHIQELYRKEPEKLIAYANRLEQGIKSMDLIHLNQNAVDFKNFPTQKIVANWSQQFDEENGGFNGAPKFMIPNNLEFLLRQAVTEDDKKLLDYVTLTLDKMAYGGLYDQIGGGFSRYSTDEKWHVPHFEKMLYDNAQLVSLYSNAFAATKTPLYAEIVKETLAFIKTELTNNEGGFYSSLDADSKDEKGNLKEGAFYIFTSEELQELLKDDFKIFKEYYNVNSYGKWENNHYVLIRKKSDPEIETEFGLTSDAFQQKKKSWKEIILDYRNKRPKPRLDDKTLTSWNALMLKGYIDAYKAFGNQEYFDAALKNAEFISQKQLEDNGALFHNYKDGKSSINGFLEDYAFTIEAFIALYQITLDEKWLDFSKKMADYTIANFFDMKKNMFYFTSKEDPAIVSRNFEYRDNVIPASNSVMAKNLFKLSKYFEVSNFEEIAHQMLKNVSGEITQYPSGFSNWLDLLLNFKNDFYEVVIVGENTSAIIKELNTHYLPNTIIAGSTAENEGPLFKNRFVPGETLIYVCKNNTCNLPVKNTQIAIKSLNKKE
ncbi:MULTISPECIES: thioredoxin domain-containing protein [Aequorivita]|uniref:Thioredoxin domain-containing protein n=1 Tax=Aequorivita iocasae TaxID=2803865 RepID=A0ABX7DWI2_9FLAO|nr:MULTISPECIES: thioredoxin domain-containing protein [Aequorivita]QQX77927.1 thioredoxin domain-containing protein [Aequorivita iocasae]UCA57428.1 thioredoxin domain-containing protein [Aequorivita sp. F7]